MKAWALILAIVLLAGTSHAGETHGLADAQSFVYSKDRWVRLKPQALTSRLGDLPPTGGTQIWLTSKDADWNYVEIGQKVWQMIQENQIVEEGKMNKFHVLPSGESAPIQLAQWKSKVGNPIAVEFNDFLGDWTIRLVYHIGFDYAGTPGKGRYLANISVVTDQLEVKTFYKINARVEVLDPVNRGSGEDPVAGLRLLVHFTGRDTLLGGTKTVTHEVLVDAQGGLKVYEMGAFQANSGSDQI